MKKFITMALTMALGITLAFQIPASAQGSENGIEILEVESQGIYMLENGLPAFSRDGFLQAGDEISGLEQVTSMDFSMLFENLLPVFMNAEDSVRKSVLESYFVIYPQLEEIVRSATQFTDWQNLMTLENAWSILNEISVNVYEGISPYGTEVYFVDLQQNNQVVQTELPGVYLINNIPAFSRDDSINASTVLSDPVEVRPSELAGVFMSCLKVFMNLDDAQRLAVLRQYKEVYPEAVETIKQIIEYGSWQELLTLQHVDQIMNVLDVHVYRQVSDQGGRLYFAVLAE